MICLIPVLQTSNQIFSLPETTDHSWDLKNALNAFYVMKGIIREVSTDHRETSSSKGKSCFEEPKEETVSPNGSYTTSPLNRPAFMRHRRNHSVFIKDSLIYDPVSSTTTASIENYANIHPITLLPLSPRRYHLNYPVHPRIEEEKEKHSPTPSPKPVKKDFQSLKEAVDNKTSSNGRLDHTSSSKQQPHHHVLSNGNTSKTSSSTVTNRAISSCVNTTANCLKSSSEPSLSSSTTTSPTNSASSSPNKLALSRLDVSEVEELLDDLYYPKKLSRGISRATDNVSSYISLSRITLTALHSLPVM